MLQRLGRWLRAAGYDTAVPGNGADDDDLLAQAKEENRILVTRDRRLAARATPAVQVVGLRSDDLDFAAEALRDRLGIDWLYAPFTRCLVDNARLKPAAPADRDRLPPGAPTTDGSLTVCPECGRLYWPGGHVRRMCAQLARWQES